MYITVNGQVIYYQKVGCGKNLVLLHGWQNDVSSFWGIVDLLKNNFTLYLVDLPGFGRSELPKKTFTVSDYSEIICSFIEKLRLHKPTLLGHSLGGRVAIKLCSQHPELISKLILEDSAGIRPKRDILKIITYVLANIIKHLLPNIGNFKNKLRIKFYKGLESDYLAAGKMKETFNKILNEDLTPDLLKIKNETLLIWGEKDPTQEASLSNGQRMYRLIPKSRIEVIDEVGHFPHLENPDRFVYYVKDFS